MHEKTFGLADDVAAGQRGVELRFGRRADHRYRCVLGQYATDEPGPGHNDVLPARPTGASQLRCHLFVQQTLCTAASCVSQMCAARTTSHLHYINPCAALHHFCIPATESAGRNAHWRHRGSSGNEPEGQAGQMRRLSTNVAYQCRDMGGHRRTTPHFLYTSPRNTTSKAKAAISRITPARR